MNEIILFLIPPIIINLLIFLNFKTLTRVVNTFDHPDNQRKLHTKKIPLVGGTIFILNTFFLFVLSFTAFETIYFDEFLFSSTRNYFSFFFLPFSFYLIGLYDDKYNLDSKTKLFLTSALIIITLLIDEELLITSVSMKLLPFDIPLNDFSLLFTLLCILLFVNAFNMIDGLNLNAGFYAIILFLRLLLSNGIYFVLLLYFISLIVFLIFNYQNKTFLGDNGSLFLSCLLAIIFIKFYNNFYISTETIIILMLIPGLDLLRLSIERVISGRHPFTADRNHLHHHIINNFNSSTSIVILQAILFTPYILSIFINIYLSLILSISAYIALFVVIYFKNRNIK